MNSMTIDIANTEIESAQEALSTQATQDAILELNAFEMALVGGGCAVVLE